MSLEQFYCDSGGSSLGQHHRQRWVVVVALLLLVLPSRHGPLKKCLKESCHRPTDAQKLQQHQPLGNSDFHAHVCVCGGTKRSLMVRNSLKSDVIKKRDGPEERERDRNNLFVT